jgi:hypothetical protein
MGRARGRALGRQPVGVQIGWPKGSGSDWIGGGRAPASSSTSRSGVAVT